MKQFGFPQIHRGGDGGGGGGGGEGESGLDAFAMGPEGFNVDNFSDPQGFGLGAFLDQDFGYGLDQATDPGNLDFGHAAFGTPGSPGSSFDEVGFDIDFGSPSAPGFSSFDEAGFGGLGGMGGPGGFADAWGGLGLGYNTDPGPSNPNLAQGFPAHRGVWGPSFGVPEWVDIPQGTPNAPPSNVTFGFPGAPGDTPGSSPGGFGAPSNASPTSAPSAPSAPSGVTTGAFGQPAGAAVGYASPDMSFGGDPGGRIEWNPSAGTNAAAPTSVGDFGYILPNGQWQQAMPTGGAYAFMDPTGQWSRYNTPNSPHSAAITPWPNDPNTPSAQDFAMNAPSSYLIGQGYKYHDPASGAAPRQFAPGERINAAGAPIYGEHSGGYFYR
jgi:hypothetical protein